MTKQLIDYNPMTGLQVFHEYNDADDISAIHYRADATPILDQNARERSEATGRMGDMEKVASIPVGVIYEWMTKYGVNMYRKDHLPAVKRLLNSSDYRWLKTRDIII